MALDFFNSPAFRDASMKVKFRMDAATEKNVEVFGKTWYSKHFAWGEMPHTSDEFKTILGKLHLDVAASTINQYSADPVRSIDGFNEIMQKIFTFSHVYKLEAEDVRKIAIHLRTFGTNETTVNYILKKLWNVREKAVNGVNNRLDLITLSALSNDGVHTFTQANDPQSPYVGSTVNFGFNPLHAATVGVANTWIDANIDTVDVYNEINDVVSRMEVKPEVILLNKAQMNYILRSAKLRLYLNGETMKSAPITAVQVNNFFSSNGLPTFEIVEKKVRVANGDEHSIIEPWKNGKLLFAPSMRMGTMESMYTDKELGLVSPNVEYSNAGRVEVTTWKHGEAENTNYTEFTRAKISAMPSIDSIADMWSLDVLQ